jgi:hypothetical protein
MYYCQKYCLTEKGPPLYGQETLINNKGLPLQLWNIFKNHAYPIRVLHLYTSVINYTSLCIWTFALMPLAFVAYRQKLSN